MLELSKSELGPWGSKGLGEPRIVCGFAWPVFPWRQPQSRELHTVGGSKANWAWLCISMSLAKQIITLHLFGRHGCRTSLRKAHTSLLFHQLTDPWLPQSRCLYVFLPLSSCWLLYSLCFQSVYTPLSTFNLLPWKASTLNKELYCMLSYH